VLALRRMAGPSLLAVSPGRARLPAAVNRLCARGAYLVHAPGQLHPAGPVHSGSLRVATLLAAGMDVALALEVHAALAARGLNAALVSMPCRSLFDAQDADYRKMVLGDAPRIAFARDTHSVFAGLTGPGDLVLGERMTSCGIVGHGGVDHAAAADHRGSEPDARSLAGFIMRHLHRTTPELEPS
jgi:transketolase